MQIAKRKHQRSEKRGKRAASGTSADTWLYGVHPVLAALANPARTIGRFLITAEAHQRLASDLPAGGPTPRIVERGELDRALPAGAVHQGVAVEAQPLPAADLEVLVSGLDPKARALVVVLDQITDPQNAGAVLRAAAAFGAAALVTTDRHAPPTSGAFAKAAAGALEAVPLIRVGNLVSALETLQSHGFWSLGLDGRAEHNIADADTGRRIALVLGAEGVGLRRLTRERCDMLARIPIASTVESLNVATAAAIALYEVTRQAARD
ncbi:MAG TPA: 23S rRNA (guanosine(2251)-2'-O)-methyltransferase RlmB [Alphaproteobacteria bacterium]|nr:23S rRNA (guanosine(2251)-2'-O)-methyltransferase RlmB [Alphaproteobacteria bacterium]